ncbi:MAG: tRNA preQ1(34) S-adenosylmethionine ribosyltransferase-isomerase QueA [Proteobacteria bacterium]|nr:MAG: tRNA preQ1(34) S-adenosylmethionine ribosyltransferase-isomerase QueA [Pseudomonadota bacterium]
MRIDELDFEYPENLVAVERAPVSRVMLFQNGEPRELEKGLSDLVQFFDKGDVLVLNDTRVNPRRVFTEAGLEILFLSDVSAEAASADSEGSEADLRTWSVLCPASRWKNGATQMLPGNVKIDIIARGRPQTVRTSEPLTEEYFEKYGELPLPPYIQKARDERHNRSLDKSSYQTAWAEKPGSLAAPTASLHFSNEDLEALKAKGVEIVRVTLHVGLGTFLPVTVENLDDHVMHGEWAEIPAATWAAIENAKARGSHIWGLGTTVTRTLESVPHGKLKANAHGSYFGETDLFIRPGFEFKVIDRLLTNFHQPRSTLLSLVSAFVGQGRAQPNEGVAIVKDAYAWAIKNQFRLFSYGDLSCWIK